MTYRKTEVINVHKKNLRGEHMKQNEMWDKEQRGIKKASSE